MKAASLINNPNSALMIAAAVVGLYVAYRVFNSVEKAGEALADGAAAVASGAKAGVQAVSDTAKTAQGFTPVGIATEAGRRVIVPVVDSLRTGGVSGAIGDFLDWAGGNVYDPNRPGGLNP